MHVYGRAPAELEAACSELALELHVFDWSASARTTGVREDALYLVRPDGYVGFADAAADVSHLRAYVERLRS